MMCRGMRKPYGLKVIRYAARLIGINEYLDFFPVATTSEKIGVSELNEIFLNRIPNSRSKQSYVQGFYCEYITKKTS